MLPSADVSLRNIDIRTLYAFLEVAKANHFGKAAKSLHISQPALSRKLRRFEDQLGASVFLRERAGVKLSAAGQLLLPFAQEIINLLADAEAALHRERNAAKGEVTIGTVTSLGAFFLPAVLNNLRKQHPGVHVRTIEAESYALEDLLLRGRLDMALLVEAPRSASIVAKRLWREGYYLFSKHRKDCTGVAASLRDLRNEYWAIPPSRSVEIFLEELHPNIRISAKTDNLETIRRFVESGLAVSILPEIIAKRLDWDVGVCRLRDSKLTRNAYLTHRGLEHFSTASRHLRSAILEATQATI